MSPRKQAVADGTAIDTKQSKARKATKHTAPGNDPVRRRRKDAAPGPDTVPAAAPQSGPVNEAEAYGVRVATAEVEPGAEYWRLVKVRHLTPLENQGKHNAFVDAVDENGLRVRDPNLRIGWTWEGRSPEEQAEPKRLDKPDDEAAGNVDIYGGMHLGVWITGDGLPSDRAENLHTNHPDEPGPNGELWNSIGHHSFALLFQRATAQDDDQGDDQGDDQDPKEWYDARYVSATIADNTIVRPGQPFVQTWTLQNNGSAAWVEGSRFERIGGAAMGGGDSVPLPPAAPETKVDISVPFVAPVEAGICTSTWQAVDPQGKRFGDPVWVTVFVAEEIIYLPNIMGGAAAAAAPMPGLDTQTVRAFEKLGLDVNAPLDPSTGAVAPQVSDAALAADTGVGWVRINCILGQQWSSPLDDKRPQGLTWGETYRFIIDNYRARKLRIYALVGHEAVAEGIGDRFRDGPGADPLADSWVQQYAGNVLAIARMFRSELDIIETFNEPDDWNGQGRNWIHPGWLSAMLEAAYRAVRSDPTLAHLRIVSAPLQGLQGPNKGNGAADYLNRVYQHGVALFGWGRDGRPFPFDGVGYHLYVHEEVTEDMSRQAADLDSTYRTYIEQMQGVIRRHEGRDKPLYISECGWFSNGDNRERWEQFQAQSLALGLKRLLGDPFVALVFAFCLQDFGRPEDNKFYGVYRQGGLGADGRKPSWEALRSVSTSPDLVPTSERPLVYDSALYVAGKDAVVDETPFAPFAAFQQVWFLRNNGTTGWGPGYTLAFTGGERLGAPERVPLPPCAPGQETPVAVPFTAASAPGRYISVWQPCNPQGELFGQAVWLIINVLPVAVGAAAGAATGAAGAWLPMTGSLPVTAHAAPHAPGAAAPVRATRSLQEALRWLVRLGVIYEGALEKLPSDGDAEEVALVVDAAVEAAKRQLETLLADA